MSSALPPIVSAVPAAPRAAPPEEVTEPGAFERALGLAASGQAPPAPPPAPLPAEAPPGGGTHADAPPALSMPQDPADAAEPARAGLDLAQSVARGPMPAHGLAMPRADGVVAPAPARTAAPTPMAAPADTSSAGSRSTPIAIAGAPLALPDLPARDAGRSLRRASGAADAADSDSPSVLATTAASRARVSPADPTPAAAAPRAAAPQHHAAPQPDVLAAPAPVAAGRAASHPEAARRVDAAAPSPAPSALPAALALDVRVIASRIAPALRRGGLLESSPTTVPAWGIGGARPSLRLDTDAPASTATPQWPLARTPVPAVAMPLAPGIAAAARPMASATSATASVAEIAVESAPVAPTPAVAPPLHAQEPVVTMPALRVMPPHAGLPPAPPRVAEPARVREAAMPQADAHEETQTPRAFARPLVVAPHDADADARTDARAGRRAPAPPAAEPPPSVAADAPAAAVTEATPAAVEASRGLRSTRLTASEAATGPTPLERAEAALEARLSPARRAADRVTLHFEGEGGLEGRLRVSVRGDQVHARLLALDGATLERLAPEMRQMQRALEEQGFRDARVSLQDLRAPGATAETRTDTRTSEDRRQGESGRRQSSDEERRGDAGPDGQRDRRRTRHGRHES